MGRATVLIGDHVVAFLWAACLRVARALSNTARPLSSTTGRNESWLRHANSVISVNANFRHIV